MNKKVLVGLVVVLVGLVVAGLILSFKMPESLTKEEKQEVVSLVEGFGKTLIKVDKVMPEENVAKSIKENYSPFLADNLILEWTFDPSKALGRVVSSPWPDRIQILSMEKLDAYTVKVKGYVVWVASGGNGNLEVTEKGPTVLIVRKDPSTQKFSIDNVYSNEFAFYDGEVLLKTLKKAFPGMYYIGERYEPYVQMVMYIGGISSKPVAVVDMGTGGAYVEYYTICLPTNGHLEVANFKDKDGHIAPLFFDEGASVKHEVKFSTFDDGKGNCILYQSVVERNDSGEVSDITVDAYRWNKSANLFEYSEEYSQEIKKELEERLVPKSVEILSLKFKEIRSEYSAIRSVAVYNGKVAFSAGSGHIKINNPKSANPNHILVCDAKSGKVEYSTQVSKDWVSIEDVQMNDNWIVFRVVEDPAGAPAECFVINRKTGKLIKLLQNYSWDGNSSSIDKDFTVDYVLLQGDYAYLVLNGIKIGNVGKTLSDTAESRLIRINLNDGTMQNFFKEELMSFGVFHLWVLGDDAIAFSASEITQPGNEKQYVYLYNFEGRSSDSVTLPDYIHLYALTLDEHIIYFRSGKIVIAPLRKPGDFEEIGLESPNDFMLVGSTVASNDYIVARLDNGNIFVFNRKTKERRIITGGDVRSEIALNGSDLSFINYPEDRNDSIIYLDLKENGF